MKLVAEGHRLIGFLYAFPALVAVHGVVASGDRRDAAGADLFHVRFQLLKIRHSALRGHIPAIQESMHRHFGQTFALRHVEQAEEVRDVAVHAAVADQTEQVQARIVREHMVHRLVQLRIFKEGTVFDRICDQRQILIDDAAGTDIEVADFAVAHLSLRQADSLAAAQQLGIGIRCEEVVKVRLFRDGDRIAGTCRRLAEAIQNHQHRGSFFNVHVLPQIIHLQ